MCQASLVLLCSTHTALLPALTSASLQSISIWKVREQVGRSTGDAGRPCWFIAMTNKRNVELVLPSMFSNFLKRQTPNWVCWQGLGMLSKQPAGGALKTFCLISFWTVLAVHFKGITLEALSCRKTDLIELLQWLLFYIFVIPPHPHFLRSLLSSLSRWLRNLLFMKTLGIILVPGRRQMGFLTSKKANEQHPNHGVKNS